MLHFIILVLSLYTSLKCLKIGTNNNEKIQLYLVQYFGSKVSSAMLMRKFVLISSYEIGIFPTFLLQISLFLCVLGLLHPHVFP
jgi:hypothetical protein